MLSVRTYPFVRRLQREESGDFIILRKVEHFADVAQNFFVTLGRFRIEKDFLPSITVRVLDDGQDPRFWDITIPYFETGF